MGIWAMNDRGNDPNNAFKYEIFHEHISHGVIVPRMSGRAVVPAREPHQFHYWWLACDNYDTKLRAKNPRVIVLPDGQKPVAQYKRILGAWGTKPNESDLIYQCQTDRLVQFHGDYTFDAAMERFHTGGKWMNRPFYYAFPPKLCCAVYFRAEAYNIANHDNAGLAAAQVNIAAEAVEGSTGDDWFRTQGKGLSRREQSGDVSHDHVRVIVMPGSESYATMTNVSSRGTLLASGYELMCT